MAKEKKLKVLPSVGEVTVKVITPNGRTEERKLKTLPVVQPTFDVAPLPPASMRPAQSLDSVVDRPTVSAPSTPPRQETRGRRKDTRGRRGLGTIAEKRQAVLDWDSLDHDTRPRLEDWLEEQFGRNPNTGFLRVPASTFQGWRRYL